MKLKLETEKKAEKCIDGTCGHPHEHIVTIPDAEIGKATATVLEGPKPPAITNEKLATEPEVITNTVAPSDEPYTNCKTCNGLHANSNYKTRPNKKCENCGSIHGSKVCKNCGNSEFEEIDTDELNELGIPEPGATTEDHEAAQ